MAARHANVYICDQLGKEQKPAKGPGSIDIQDCLVLHGHYGYTQDYPVEQRLRDVLGQIIADGTPQIMKMIIARQMLGRDFA